MQRARTANDDLDIFTLMASALAMQPLSYDTPGASAIAPQRRPQPIASRDAGGSIASTTGSGSSSSARSKRISPPRRTSTTSRCGSASSSAALARGPTDSRSTASAELLSTSPFRIPETLKLENTMSTRYLSTRFNPDPHGPAPRAFFAFGIWLRTGFVASSLAAIALVMLANGEASALPRSRAPSRGSSSRRSHGAGPGFSSMGSSRQNRANCGSGVPRPRRAGFGAPVESAASR